MVRSCYIGLDPGESERCAFSIQDERGNFIDAGFFGESLPPDLADRLTDWITSGAKVCVAIDGPRHQLPRHRYWDWQPVMECWSKSLRGLDAGRHAEIVFRAHGVRQSRWTGLASAADARQRFIASLYAGCAAIAGLEVLEVCAQVSLWQFDGMPPEPDGAEALEANLTDAALAAGSAREFHLGRGMEIGGGDGLGTIVLPRRLPPLRPAVLRWPEERDAVGAVSDASSHPKS